MKQKPTLAPLALMLLMLAGCGIEKVEEHQATGTLYFRAINAYDEQEIVSGLLEIDGRSNLSFVEGSGFLAINDLPLDSTISMRFTPYNTDEWFPTGTQVFNIPSSSRADTLTQLLYSRADSLLSVRVVTQTGSGLLSGMPLWLDGQRWPEDSPATLYFTSLTDHHLVVRDEHCTRADTVFNYSEQPTADMAVEVSSVTLTVDPGLDGLLLLDGTEVGQSLWSLQNPAMGDYFFSAFRPGFVATPAWASLSGLCGGSQTFSWTPADEGYTAGSLFPDFTLEQVLPGQTTPIGTYSLRQLRGRLVLMTYWYVTCVNCQLEMPGFQAMLDQYADRGFRVVAMDPFPTDDPVQFPDFDFIFLRDVGTPPVAQLAGVSAFPTNFLILPDGSIHSVRGSMTVEMLESLLTALLPQ